MLSWELEDWITDAGAALVEKRFLQPQSLSALENLVYEIWLLDTEARNGGLSQYFLNHGLTQWRSCVAAAIPLQSFRPFVLKVQHLLVTDADPFTAIHSHGDDAEDMWYGYQPQVVAELRQFCGGAL